MTEWEPIETAPKSAGPILILSQTGRIYIGTGRHAHEMIDVANIYGEPCFLTHWMHLPDPPREPK